MPEFQERGRTKIVATVGPASRSEEMLTKLVEAGVDVFRLNMAHASLEEHTVTVERIRRVREAVGRPVAILVDLAGPKIRLGTLFEDPLECKENGELSFVRGEKAGSAYELVCNYEPLLDELSVGDSVVLADGVVGLRVIAKSVNRVTCRVTEAGIVRSRQGVNLPGVRLSVPSLTEADRTHALWATRSDIDYVSLSFVRRPDDITSLKELLRDNQCDASVIAKIEKPEALEHLDDIVLAADAVMVARGDLGVEIDVAAMPVAQKRIIDACTRLKRPVIVATQMLESMHTSRRPTRAEATDVANAILDGADACMLSGETAIGDFPVEAVKMMNRIMVSTEEMMRDFPPRMLTLTPTPSVHPITDAAVFGAGRIAKRLHAKLVMIATRRGGTALAKAKQRDFIRTVAICDRERTLRKMCLLWGIIPVAGQPIRDDDALRIFIDDWGKKTGLLQAGDRVVFLSDSDFDTGAHDMMILHEVGSASVQG